MKNASPHPPASLTPASGACPAEEKRVATVHARVSEQLALFLDREAQATGASKSAVLASLLSRQRAANVLAGSRSTSYTHSDSLLVAIDALREEATIALADGRLTGVEKANLARDVAAILTRIFPKRHEA